MRCTAVQQNIALEKWRELIKRIVTQAEQPFVIFTITITNHNHHRQSKEKNHLKTNNKLQNTKRLPGAKTDWLTDRGLTGSRWQVSATSDKQPRADNTDDPPLSCFDDNSGDDDDDAHDDENS